MSNRQIQGIWFLASGKSKTATLSIVHDGKTLNFPISKKRILWALESGMECIRTLEFGRNESEKA